jgi:hypothetical protein
VGQPGRVVGHVFISYAHEDSQRVEQLQQILEAAGIPVWRDTDRLWPGEDWHMKIRKAITGNALVFIACFSSQSAARTRGYQNEELTLAVEELRLRRPDVPWLIPVRFDECHIPDRDLGGGRRLQYIQRADLFNDKFREGAARLVATILQILRREPGPATSYSAPPGPPPSDDFAAALRNLARRFRARQPRQAYEHAFSEPYEAIDPPILATDRNTQSRFFSFGVPAGWHNMTGESLSNLATFAVLAGVSTSGSYEPRTNFFVGYLFDLDREDDFSLLLANPQYWLNWRTQRLSQNFPTRAASPPVRISLDRRPSLLLDFWTAVPGHLFGQSGEIPVILTEILTAVGQYVFMVTFSGPAARRPELLPAFQTMLGTWQWSYT